ncbi:hypothetical protein ACS0TY_021107 [Phlomoides rotata]
MGDGILDQPTEAFIRINHSLYSFSLQSRCLSRLEPPIAPSSPTRSLNFSSTMRQSHEMSHPPFSSDTWKFKRSPNLTKLGFPMKRKYLISPDLIPWPFGMPDSSWAPIPFPNYLNDISKLFRVPMDQFTPNAIRMMISFFILVQGPASVSKRTRSALDKTINTQMELFPPRAETTRKKSGRKATFKATPVVDLEESNSVILYLSLLKYSSPPHLHVPEGVTA